MKVIREYKMAGDGCQAPGAIVLVDTGREPQPFATYFRNDQDSEREGKPCYYSGTYESILSDAEATFEARCKRYDPTGRLHAAAMAGEVLA